MDLSTRNMYIVAYDIADPKRLNRVAKTLRGWGDRVQWSVFRCELSPREKVDLRVRLLEVINVAEDQVVFIDLGPVDGRGSDVIESIGTAVEQVEHGAIVI